MKAKGQFGSLFSFSIITTACNYQRRGRETFDQISEFDSFDKTIERDGESIQGSDVKSVTVGFLTILREKRKRSC